MTRRTVGINSQLPALPTRGGFSAVAADIAAGAAIEGCRPGLRIISAGKSHIRTAGCVEVSQGATPGPIVASRTITNQSHVHSMRCGTVRGDRP